MSMAAFVLPKFSLPELIFIGLILLMFIARAFKGSSRSKERSAVLQSMGFLEIPREQAFESAQVAARIINDSLATSILSPVGKGTSALGETVIFDISHRDDKYPVIYTGVGFRVPPSIPDFEIRHVLLLDGVFQSPAASEPEAPGMRGRARIGPSGTVPEVLGPAEDPVVIESHPEFAKKYVVKAADQTAMRHMLTSNLMDALTALNDSNVRIKGKDWLFVFRWGGRLPPPEQYPALLEEAVGLVSRFDLRAAS